MSDFDRVLERLLTDSAFKAAIAADPARALAPYQLSEDELELLHAPVATDSGEDRTVEIRTSKSGVFGLVGPVVAAFGVAGSQSFGSSSDQSMGSAPGDHYSYGNAPQSGGDNVSFGDAQSNESFGDATSEQTAPAQPPLVEAAGYHTRVDVDGDGDWDAHTAYERADGGVDIHADMNADGVADFIGHDVDRDGLVDSADYDRNLDGVMDTRWYDDNGDGWLDRREALPPPVSEEPPLDKASPPGDEQTFGHAPA